MSSKSLIEYCRITVVVFLLLTIFFGWQATHFKINASADTLLVKDNKNYLITQQANQRYAPKEFILIAFRPDHFGIFSEQVLTTIKEISTQIGDIDRVAAVRSLVNIPIFTDLDSFSADINPDELTWEKQHYNTDEFERKLTNHPLYEGLLFNSKKTALAMQVVFKERPKLVKIQSQMVDIESHLLERELTDSEEKELKKLQKQKEVISNKLNRARSEEIQKIRHIIEPYQQVGDFYLGGNNLLADELISIIKSDLLLFGTIILIIVSCILYFLFRQVRWVLIPLLCCALSVIFTLGLLGVLNIKVTVISANVFALQIILTLAVIIHLIVQYQELAQSTDGNNREDLVIQTVKKKVKPCFYAGLTTTIGFGSLVFSGVQPVISFGWMMVVAMAVTLLVSLLLFPAILLSFFNSTKAVKQHAIIESGMKKGASLVENHSAGIVITCLIVAGLGVAGCFRLTAENSFLNYFSKSTDVYRELSFIDKHFGGSTPFDILYTIPPKQTQSDLVITADAVQTVRAIQDRLAENKAVGNITSIADFTRIAKTVTGKPLTEYELTVVYRSLNKNLREDLFGAYFSADANQVRISSRIQDTTKGLNRADLIATIKQDMADLGIEEDSYELTNLFVLYQDILSRLVKSQFLTLGIVYLAMALILVFIFRSVKVALICLVPNVITTAVIMGTMGWANIPLDLMTITIAAVAMGISVDDTIHYVHRYLEEQKLGAQGAIQRTHLSVGYAVVYTTVIIVVGFSSLVFSQFVPSILFGALTSVAMIVALLTDISILPVLLNRYLSGNSR